jgi:hypothetical protein
MRFTALSKSSEWATGLATYPDGSSQRYTIPATAPRARFRVRARLGATAMAALRAFYAARKARKEPFFLYWPWETNPLFSHYPTGTETDGRYTVRFDSDWTQSQTLQRGEIELELVEID